MNVESIKIRNFRSLANIELNFSRLNIFVGKNDSGKSNVLRALDLFFNYGRGYPFLWKQDFCAFTQSPRGKAAEIEISLDISPPKNFSDQTPVRWKRSWRQSGLHREEIKHLDRSELSPKNKFGALLKSIRYDYVPAIKGEAYFSRLLGNMYDMLELTVENEIRSASAEFMTSINAHTGTIIHELLDRLDLNSSIELPANLRELFAQLDFRSTHNDRQFSLGQRGDGIKVRHIPIILRWLAKQAQTLSAPGRPKVVTIWGYEEPENNLEMGRCNDMANDFYNDSIEIQTFITSHSPAFYSIFRKDEEKAISLFGVKKINDSKESEISLLTKSDLTTLDDSMGLMPLVAPYYENAIREIEQIKLHQVELPSTERPVLFVEGLTDKTIISAATEFLFPDLRDQFEIFAKPNGGYNWVADRLIAWAHSGAQTVGVGLFDCDPDATKAKEKAMAHQKVQENRYAKAHVLGKSRHLQECAQAGFLIPYAIEELFPPSIWEHAEQSGWLVPREGLPTLFKFDKTDITFNKHLMERVPNIELARYVRMKVHISSKKRFARFISQLDEDQKPSAFEPLIDPLRAIFRKLGLELPADNTPPASHGEKRRRMPISAKRS